MPQENGETNFGSALGFGIRGSIPPEPGTMVQSNQTQGQMGTGAFSQAGTGSLANQAGNLKQSSQKEQAAQEISMKGGINTKLTNIEIEQAIKIRVHKLRRSRGLPVPSDPFDFQNRARIYWIEDGAMITWEE